jgi:hypothetical protein
MMFLAENVLNAIQGVSMSIWFQIFPKNRHTTHPVHGDPDQAVLLAEDHQTAQQ